MLTIFFITKFNKNDTLKEEGNILYPESVITIMKEKNVYDEIKTKEYSKTIEKMLENGDYKSNYLEAYTKIKWKDLDNFTSLTNLFLEKKYSPEEINDIFEYLNDTNLNKLTEQDYINLKEYVKVSNMEIDKIERYEKYREKNNTSIMDTVTQVNIGLDIPFYEEIKTIENPDSYTTLVNKYNAIREDYTPSDLVSLSFNSNYKLRKKAAESYEELTSAALLDQVIVYPFSAYRTKNYQNGLYTNYSKRDGVKAADTYSARPRHSEHELGLAVDIRSKELNDNLTDNDYKWMLDNAHKFGFIVRYPKGSTNITGYIEEPWHLRYVGTEVAKEIHEKGITFDEYYDLYLKNQAQKS